VATVNLYVVNVMPLEATLTTYSLVSYSQ
jgi:hypothetical protein